MAPEAVGYRPVWIEVYEIRVSAIGGGPFGGLRHVRGRLPPNARLIAAYHRNASGRVVFSASHSSTSGLR
jgi:hypothetical protein